MRCLLIVASSLLALLPLPPAHAASRILDDFEDRELRADTGLHWVPICDDQFGGASRIAVEAATPGFGGSRGAMRLHGRARRGEIPITLAGAWVGLGPRGEACSLAGYDRLRFRVRGHADALEVGVRRGPGGTAQVNFMAPFRPSAEWTTVEIALAGLKPQIRGGEPPSWDPSECWYLGFATPLGQEMDFDVQVDDLELLGPGPAAPAPAPSDGPVFSQIAQVATAAPSADLSWRPLAQDEPGDGLQGSLPDARTLWYTYEGRDDRVWFRVSLENELPGDWLGINVAVDADRDQGNGSAWWGTNSAFRWDRLFTAYLFRVGSSWQGMFGVADSAGVARGEMGSVARSDIRLCADRATRSLYVGVPRKCLDDDLDMNVIATVGSAMTYNDDVPSTGWATTTTPGVRRW